MYSLTFRVCRFAVMCTDCQYAWRYVVTATKPANPPNNAQLGAPSTIPPSYIRVRAVVWACGRDRHTDARDYYTFHVVYDSREM